MDSEDGIGAGSMKLFYGPEDFRGDYNEKLGNPGEFPYTRGTRRPRARPEGETGEQVVRALSGEGSAARSNQQFHYLLENGATGLDVIGDTPTMASMDPDHPYARHSIGNQGVSLCRAADWERLYKEVPLNRVSVSHSVPPSFGIAGFYLAAIRLGWDPGVLRGSVISAPLYSEDTCYSNNLPVELHMRLATDGIIFSSERMPRFHPFVEDTYYISDGSIEAIDEMALGFIELREVTRRVMAAGKHVDSFAPRLALLVNCRMNLFEEIAKIRASRRIYAQMMRDEFGAKDPRSLAINVTVHTSGATMTAEQLTNNIVRGTCQAVAMTMAGVRAVEISAFDEAVRTPTEDAHSVSLRTQLVVQLETGVGDVADPLGGSYYVEALTDELESRIESRIREIESFGDILELSGKGFFRGIFADAMVERAREVQEGRRMVVGVNVHKLPSEEDTLLREITEKRIEPAHEISDEIAEWRAGRDTARVVRALDELEAIGHDPSRNVTAGLVDALRADATLGECVGVLREAYGMPYDPLGKVHRPR